MEEVIRSALEALAQRSGDAADRFRLDVVAAMPRFHAPQLERLRATFDRIAAELGRRETWS